MGKPEKILQHAVLFFHQKYANKQSSKKATSDLFHQEPCAHLQPVRKERMQEEKFAQKGKERGEHTIFSSSRQLVCLPYQLNRCLGESLALF